MAGRKKTFNAELRDNAAAMLSALPEKPAAAKEMTSKELLDSLKTQIKEAQSSGYTLDEIVVVLKNSGVEIGLTTLKNAIRSGARKPKKQSANDGANAAVNQKQKREITPAERAAMKDNETLTDGAKKAIAGEY